ncbi:MAG: L-fuculose-phosphate aldolase [Candidatus Eremiobacteraeota bacterium]|jgi:L-fuculose-phosphate aldolase|nr:L-fuculose-phosphate aldolase [Candidatus Eremiobacteraeota bacterium]
MMSETRQPDTQIRAAIVATCVRMTELGLNHGTAGNVSVRVGERFLVTPSGVDYDRLTPESIVSVAFDGSFEGSAQPSSEWRLHAALLQARPEMRAVVHTHSPHATAVACLREPIPSFHYLVGLGGRAEIPCAAYATYGTAELAANAVAVLRDGKTCLLANHGALALGTTLRQALALAASVETLATQYVLARQIGTPVLLDQAEMARAIDKLGTYGPNRPEPDAAY